jgi:hypothetical protein
MLTRRKSNKNAIPPCVRIFTLVLRFLAPATVILSPARQKKLNLHLSGGLKAAVHRHAQINHAY